MVRATAAEVVKKWGGTYPAGWDATSVGNVCAQVDAELDAKALPDTLGTGTNEAEFANEYTFRKINYQRWTTGNMDTPPPARPWDDEMKDWFAALLSSTSLDGFGTPAMWEQ